MKKIDTKRMGELLTMLREDAGLSRKGACAAAGCTYAALANLEKGKNEPRLSTLFALCETYGKEPRVVIEMFTTATVVVGVDTERGVITCETRDFSPFTEVPGEHS